MEKIQRTCRYGHGALENLTKVNENGELFAFALAGMKFWIYAISPARNEPVLTAAPEASTSYIAQLHKCPVCGYLELEDLTDLDVIRLIKQKEAHGAVGSN